MHLEQLYFFLRVAEVQHVTNAAQELNVSQPALSRSIKRLEQELGIELFRKSGRGIELTDSGRVFANHALNALQELNAGIAYARSQSGTLSGELSVGGIITARTNFMLPLLDEYQRRYPGVNVTDHLGVSVDLRANVLDGRYDIVIAGPIDDPRLEKRPIYSQQLVLYAPRCHRASRFNTVTMEDLRGMDVASYASDTLVGGLSDAFISDQLRGLAPGQDPESFFGSLTRTCSEETTLAHQVQKSKCVGIGLLTSHLLPYPDLVMVPFEEPASRAVFDVSLYWRNDRLMSPCLQAFVDCFEEVRSSVSIDDHIDNALTVTEAFAR